MMRLLPFVHVIDQNRETRFEVRQVCVQPLKFRAELSNVAARPSKFTDDVHVFSAISDARSRIRLDRDYSLIPQEAHSRHRGVDCDIEVLCELAIRRQRGARSEFTGFDLRR